MSPIPFIELKCDADMEKFSGKWKGSKKCETVSWKFNHKIITAGMVKICPVHSFVYQKVVHFANALIVKVIFQLNATVSIRLRLTSHDTFQARYHVKSEGQNFTI